MTRSSNIRESYVERSLGRAALRLLSARPRSAAKHALQARPSTSMSDAAGIDDDLRPPAASGTGRASGGAGAAPSISVSRVSLGGAASVAAPPRAPSSRAAGGGGFYVRRPGKIAGRT